jgi:hypothetical protein
MELIEGSETSAISNQTPGKHPKENILHVKHGESLKSRKTLESTSAATPKGQTVGGDNITVVSVSVNPLT